MIADSNKSENQTNGSNGMATSDINGESKLPTSQYGAEYTGNFLDKLVGKSKLPTFQSKEKHMESDLEKQKKKIVAELSQNLPKRSQLN